MVSLLILVWKFFLTRKFDRQKRAKVPVKHEIVKVFKWKVTKNIPASIWSVSPIVFKIR